MMSKMQGLSLRPFGAARVVCTAEVNDRRVQRPTPLLEVTFNSWGLAAPELEVLPQVL